MRGKLFTSLRSRVWMAIAVAVLVPLVTVMVVGGMAWQELRTTSNQAGLMRQAELIAAMPGAPDALQNAARVVTAKGERVEFIGANEARHGLGDRALKKLDAGQTVTGTLTQKDVAYLFAAKEQSGASQVIVRVMVPRGLSADIRSTLFFAALVSACVAAIAAFLIARTVVNPVEQLAVASSELAAGQRPPTLEPHGPAEMRRLTESFNALAAGLPGAAAAAARTAAGDPPDPDGSSTAGETPAGETPAGPAPTE